MRLPFLILFLPCVALAKQPNVLLIMADDIGIEGFGCYGGTSYETPQIDKLAKGGMRFTHAYSQPLCTPTRVQIMTGRYNHRNWSYFGILDPEEKTFGHMMKESGYKTCISGKWQLQSYDPPDFPNAERRRGQGMKVTQAGFDEHCLFHSWHTEKKGSRYAGPTYFKNGKLVTERKNKYEGCGREARVFKVAQDNTCLFCFPVGVNCACLRKSKFLFPTLLSVL